jgi:hypothetical protein
LNSQKLFFGGIFFLCPLLLFSQLRSLNDLFPSGNTEQLAGGLSSKGYLYYGQRSENLSLLLNASDSARISKSMLGPNPGFFVEALRVVPRRNIELLNVYNALEKIRGLKGRMHYSASTKKSTMLFTNAVRLEGPDKLKSFLPDPPPFSSIPFFEKFYVRLTDAQFGHCYYEISLTAGKHGILYRINNFKTVTYGPIPVIKEKTLTALIYIEPVKEGLALYCLAGAEVSDFITKHVDVGSALTKRMDVFIEWLLDGLE